MDRYRQLATTTTATVTKGYRQRVRLECTRYITIHSSSSNDDDGDDDDDNDGDDDDDDDKVTQHV